MPAEIIPFPSKRARTNTCGHTNRKHYGKGMCASCYDKSRWRPSGDPENEGSDLLEIRPKYHCALCGDGYSNQRTKCTLYPNICNGCHAVYCEGSVEGVELTPLEDIINMDGERQVKALYARKLTLRAAGKKTSHLPLIQVDSPLDEERVGTTEVKMHVIRPWSYE